MINNTGGTETFTLSKSDVNPFSDPTVNAGWNAADWTSIVYIDVNGDNVYTAGVDYRLQYDASNPAAADNGKFCLDSNNDGLCASETLLNAGAGADAGFISLGQGQGQDIGVRVSASSASNISHVKDLTGLTALGRSTRGADGATDTTVVTQPSMHDLSGGGTRQVAVPTSLPAVIPGATGDPCKAPASEANCGEFQGVLYALPAAPQIQSFTLDTSASSLDQLENATHPTELSIDANCNGTART